MSPQAGPRKARCHPGTCSAPCTEARLDQRGLIQRDCHALVEGARYSVLWRLVGKQLLARVGSKSVELCWEDTSPGTTLPVMVSQSVAPPE